RNTRAAVGAGQYSTPGPRPLGASRRSLFDEIEYPALKVLPATPYELAEWKKCRPGLDYHVEIDTVGEVVPGIGEDREPRRNINVATQGGEFTERNRDEVPE